MPSRSNMRKVYGIRKTREMQRSVLASTDRHGSHRSLTAIRRRCRRVARSQLSRLRGPVSLVLAVDDYDLSDMGAWPRHEIREAVLRRRDADKISPLVRWAIATTRHVPPEDRLSVISAALPATLIGRHALSHLEYQPELRDPRRPLTWIDQILERTHELDRSAAQRHADLRRVVDRLVRDGRHGDLNAGSRVSDRTDAARVTFQCERSSSLPASTTLSRSVSGSTVTMPSAAGSCGSSIASVRAIERP